MLKDDTAVNRVRKDIERFKRKLVKKALRRGLYENFGQQELRTLEDKYSEHRYKSDGVFDAIDAFANWAMTFDVHSLKKFKKQKAPVPTSTVRPHTRKTKKGITLVRGHLRRN